MNTILPWLLVLVIDAELVEHGTYDTRKHCMLVGSHFVEATLRDTEDAQLDGFFCDEEKPEKVSQVIPACLAPMKECA